jgi:hypothetical protein
MNDNKNLNINRSIFWTQIADINEYCINESPNSETAECKQFAEANLKENNLKI